MSNTMRGEQPDFCRKAPPPPDPTLYRAPCCFSVLDRAPLTFVSVQISAEKLLTRKTALALRVINPNRATNAITGIWQVNPVLEYESALRTLLLSSAMVEA